MTDAHYYTLADRIIVTM